MVLHIGTGRTGTTSIQNSLGSGIDILLNHNIYYPGIQPLNIFSPSPIFIGNLESFKSLCRKLDSQEDKKS